MRKSLKQSKKGQISIEGAVAGLILVVVGLIVILNIFGSTAGDVTAALDNASGSGLPLGSLFSSDGVVALVYVAGILLGVIGLALSVPKFLKGKGGR